MKGHLKISGYTVTVTVEEDGIRTTSEHVVPETDIDLSQFKRARKEMVEKPLDKERND